MSVPMEQRACPWCQGAGRVGEARCHACEGFGAVRVIPEDPDQAFPTEAAGRLVADLVMTGQALRDTDALLERYKAWMRRADDVLARAESLLEGDGADMRSLLGDIDTLRGEFERLDPDGEREG